MGIKSITVLSMAFMLAACASDDQRVDESQTSTGASPEIDRVRSELKVDQLTSLEEIVVTASRQEYALYDMSLPSVQSFLHQAPPRIAYLPVEANRENYLDINENSVRQVLADPVSTFSIDVDTASYSNIRRMLSGEGRLPPSDAVKLEEMVNYFSYSYPSPDNLEQPFSVHTEVAPAPWNDQKLLLQIGLKGYEPDRADRPSANLVFLVDVSGSMQSPDKLGLVKKSLRLLVNQMDANDRIALVVYAGAAGLVLDSTSASERSKILRAVENLEAGGSTNGSAGIRLAYEVAQQNQIEGGINRILIASDGDMNVGITSVDDLKELIEDKRKTGIALTTLGFGSGNYNDAVMEQLADVGNGNAAYIDSLLEAQKVLVNEMQSTLLTIAKDVKIQVEFNPNFVSEYRLLGYENRMLQREDFRNDQVDAGEIGAGHTVTALYELTLKGSSAEMIPDLRYQNEETTSELVNFDQEIAYVNLRYKLPEESVSTEFGQPVSIDSVETGFESASTNLRFAASVASFGQLLRDSNYTNGMSFDQVLDIARSARGDDQHGYRSEFLSLVELAKSLSAEPLVSQVQNPS